LIAAGAQVNTEAGDGTTALSLVAERGWTGQAKMLLEAKADPNAGKMTLPLFGAIAAKNLELAELLLKAGANPNMAGGVNFRDARVEQDANYMNHKGHMTPLWFAIYQNQPALVKLLLNYKADPNDAQTDRQPVIFKTLDTPEMLAALLAAGANVEARDETENVARTPLLKASQFFGGSNVVGILLQHGANPNAVDAQGDTPLHLAAGNLAFEETFALLLEHKANPNVRNQSGQTPLDLVKSAMTFERWRFSQNTGRVTSEQKAFAEKMAALLRAHGALDYLPDWNRITVSRPSANYAATVFQRGTNDWNQFTLLEVIYHSAYYRQGQLDFPDLSHIVVARPSANGAEVKRIPVNLLNETNGLDFSQDIPLQFGDVVEIPGREHALAETPTFFNKQQNGEIGGVFYKRAGEAKLVVAGSKTVQLRLPAFYPTIKQVLNDKEAQAVLTSSSDLSRVKVTRREARTGKTREWIVDCAPEKRAGNSFVNVAGASINYATLNMAGGSLSSGSLASTTDLWLRAGDVIEVPEKR
jgi:ankyrin repeat protein